MSLESVFSGEIRAEKFQIFTPSQLVVEALDLAGYSGDILGKKVLETSCGDGAFLVQIVQRYIESAKSRGLDDCELKAGLEADIVGFEIDEKMADKARDNLNYVANSHGISNVCWRLYTEDMLLASIEERFDYVIGNPPYLEYKTLDPAYRLSLREKYHACSKGKFDYCYAFIEASLSRLSKEGILVQIVPNSIFKNQSASALRALLLSEIEEIVDYAGMNVFSRAQISPCLFRLKKASKSNRITYIERKKNRRLLVRKDLLNDKWAFADNRDVGQKRRFGDYFKVSMPIATLCNDAFLVKEESSDIESAVLLDARSPRSCRKSDSARIIFPYKIEDDGVPARFSEEDFSSLFPKAFAHLSRFRGALETRKADKSVSWFEYGRRQGFASIAQKKLLLSTVVTNRIMVYELPEWTVPYGGMVVTVSDGSACLEHAKRMLESSAFFDYASSIGTSVSGASVRITCKDVENFLLNKTDFE